jgi:hypothetical protein
MSHQRLTVSFVAALSVVSWMGTNLHAQGRGRGFQMGAEGIRMRLLGIDKVRDALKLTDEQKPELAKITTAFGEEGESFRASLQNLSQEERTKKFAERQEKTKATWEKCEKILTSEQVDRIKQISRQARGATALGDEDVVLALKLTDDQKKQLETIRDAAGQEMGALFQQQGLEQEARQKKVAEIQKTSGEKALAVLSDEQKKEFEKLQGEKIELPEGALFPGFGGRRP